jgi:hypothetical protein
MKPMTPEQAAFLVLSPLAPTNTIELRPSYTTIRPDGHLGGVDVRLGLWMPYVLVPGIKARNMGSIVILDLSFETLHTPMVGQSGIGDLTFIDQAVYVFKWGGLALGPAFSFPSATSALFGFGKLVIGPAFSVGVSKVPRSLLTLTLINGFSVAGAANRPDVDILYVVPTIGVQLPRAFFLRFDPVWTFDWKRSGYATVPVNLAAGHAFTKRLLAFIQPEWVTTGTLQNSFTIRLGLTCLGW